MATDQMPPYWYEDYERGRPGYPESVINIANVPSSATALEVAAGTGKLTRLLVSRFVRVVAVEPDPGMRRLLSASCPESDVMDGSAEHIPLAANTVDAIFVAQAFHWFDNEAALTEFSRVLRPHGAIVVMWNVADGPIAPPIGAVEKLLVPIWPQEFDFPLDMMTRGWTPNVWQHPYARANFDPIREVELANHHSVDAQGLIAFYGSMGWFATLPHEDRQRLLDKMKSHLTATEYVLPWHTLVQWTQLCGPASLHP